MVKRINKSHKEIEFQTLAEDAPVMLWLTNIDGEIIFSNNKRKKFVGSDKIESQGGDAWHQALHPEDRDRCVNILRSAFSTHRPFEMEYRLKRLDGEYRNMLDTGEPYILDDGVFSGFR